jgi:two-component system CheB/CheR fusion protein
VQRLFCIRLHTLYKLGTLQRRIERRMAMASIESGGMDRYLDVLRSDPIELGHLAEDLLINVTRFFRDAKVFDYLAAKIVPDLVRNHSFDADCSDGCEH